MLKISVTESRSERRLIVEGKLLGPWVTELKTACGNAMADIQDREFIVDLENVTAISEEGENVLLQLMNKDVKFSCGVFTKQVLMQLARRKHAKPGPIVHKGKFP